MRQQEFEYKIIQVVKDVPKNDRGEVIRIAWIDFGRGPRLDIRNWFTNQEGELAMGKGISIHTDSIEDVANAVWGAFMLFEEGEIK